MQCTTVAGLIGTWSVLLRRQLAHSRRVWIFAGALFALVMAVAQVMSFWLGQPIWYFTQDPATTTLMSWSLGFVSQFGIMLWSATVAVCMMAGVLLWPLREHRQPALFAYASAAVCLVYLLDDALLVHESILRDHLGVPEAISFALYGALFVFLIIRFASIIRRTNYVILLVALGFGGISVMVDLINPYLFWLEDGSKFMALALWSGFYFQTMTTLVWSSLPSSPDHSPGA